MDLRQQLKRDEGERLEVYLDSRGIRTGGVGHNLEAHGIDWPVGTPIPQEVSDQWLDADIATATSTLKQAMPWTIGLTPPRLGALINMCFNLGIGGLLRFHRTLTFLEDNAFTKASEEMLKSEWSKQVGDRATRLSEQVLTGEWV